MSTDWIWPGSRWWRVDLHTHSPASYDFGTQQDREAPDWSRWVEAASSAGLHAVAVTDHNTAAAIDELKAAAESQGEGPTILPGVEVTASCGTHLLLVLGPDATSSHVDEFLSRANIGADLRGSDTARSSSSIEEILSLADQRTGVFLAAHVNGPAGLLKHEGQQRIQELRHQNLAGVEVDPDRELDESWIDGSRPEIGRNLPRVWCSDAHQFDDLGRRFTWVKMTNPDLEGLRLALLDGDDSSLRPRRREQPGDPNRHATLAIESLSVQAAKYMGRPSALEFHFNPWLNTIIGGRGTGKSTLLDFCRKVLRRDKELDGTSLRENFDRRLSVPGSRRDEGLLTDLTNITVVYRKDGERFEVSWDRRGETPAIKRFDGQDWLPDDGDVRDRFPVRIYSQKQLFELAQDPNALLRVIDDSPSVRGSDWERKIEEAGDRYLSLRAGERAARAKAEELASRRASLVDVKRKLDLLQRGGGTQALAAYRKASQQDDTWQSILEDAERRVEAVAEVSEELAVADLDLGEVDDDDTARVALSRQHERLRETVTNLKSELIPRIERARRDLEVLRAEEDVDAQAWKAALNACRVDYERAAEQLAKGGISSPAEYRDLVGQASALKKEIRSLELEAGRADRLREEAANALAEHRRRLDAWSQARAAFANLASGNLLRVAVNAHAGQDREAIVSALRERLGIERFDADYENIASRIANDGEPWSWTRLDSVVNELTEIIAGGGETQTFRDRRFRAALERLAPERLDRLALYAPDDVVEVSFRDAPTGSWSPLSQGSPGQQTAALLAFVLGYGEEPILLDQPEDDLDNTLIYKVLVQRLRETKATRQVIVVTHNPNIVVHGDAEFVLSLDARGGQTHVVCQGGLQEQEVRDEICRVMEGGKEAFEDRYRRMMPVGGRPR